MKDLLKNKTFLAAVLGAVLGALGGAEVATAPGTLCPCDGVVMQPPVACPPMAELPCDATAGKAD